MTNQGPWIVGSGAEADIQLNQPMVSGTHLKVERSGEGFIIQDLDSTNGTTVDGKFIHGPTPILGDAPVLLGSYRTTVDALLAGAPGINQPVSPAATHDPNRTIPTSRPPAGTAAPRTVHVKDTVLIVGRDSSCDVVIPEPTVSGRHARVFRNAGRIIIEDMGSMGGTHITRNATNEEISIRSVTLGPEDRVRIGSSTFYFQRDPSLQVAQLQGATVNVKGLSVTVSDRDTGLPRKIVNRVSFTALPGEVVGIMGASGSGKTTLLNVLAGFTTPSEGQVLVAGENLFEATGEIRPHMATYIGHAPQHSQVHSELTVEEAVLYSARLRGLRSWSEAEIRIRVDAAIEAVDLTHKKGTTIGSEEEKVLSGGQIKRVNIAMELVNAPQVLLLDEPTSGLSSEDTKDVMQVVRKLADTGRTIILIIHQPSYSTFLQIDHLLLLKAGGFTTYFGPAAQDSFDFFRAPARHPESILEQLNSPPVSGQGPEYWVDHYEHSELKAQWVDRRGNGITDSPGQALEHRPPRNVFKHAVTLLNRSMLIKLGWHGGWPRDKFFWGLSFLVPAVVAMLFAMVLTAQITDSSLWSFDSASVEHSFLVVLTIMVCFFGALSAALEINKERVILRRERRGGVSLTAYLISKAIFYALPSFCFPLIALGVISVMASNILEGSFVQYWLILSVAFFAASCAGLLISAIILRSQTVILVAVFYAIVQVVFSAFVPLHVTYDRSNVDGKVTKASAQWLQGVSGIITARWTLGGLSSVSDLCMCDGQRGQGRCKGKQGPRGVHLPVPVSSAAEDDPDNVVALDRGKVFQANCRQQFYQDHGIEEAGKHVDRVERLHWRKSVGLNLLFAFGSLFLAGLALARKQE